MWQRSFISENFVFKSFVSFPSSFKILKKEFSLIFQENSHPSKEEEERVFIVLQLTFIENRETCVCVHFSE